MTVSSVEIFLLPNHKFNKVIGFSWNYERCLHLKYKGCSVILSRTGEPPPSLAPYLFLFGKWKIKCGDKAINKLSVVYYLFLYMKKGWPKASSRQEKRCRLYITRPLKFFKSLLLFLYIFFLGLTDKRVSSEQMEIVVFLYLYLFCPRNELILHLPVL